MSENATEAAEPTTEASAQEPAKPEAPEIDWKAKAREWEKRAKENKSAAEKLAEIEEASKTAEQKAAERLAEMEAQAKALEAKAARAEIASETGIPSNILAGPEDSSPEAIKAYADLLIAYTENAGKPRPPKPDTNQGRSGTGSASTADQFAAAFEGGFH